MPYDFFMSRYKEAYRIETEASSTPSSTTSPRCRARRPRRAGDGDGGGPVGDEQVDFGEIIEQEFGTSSNFGALLDAESAS